MTFRIGVRGAQRCRVTYLMTGLGGTVVEMGGKPLAEKAASAASRPGSMECLLQECSW